MSVRKPEDISLFDGTGIAPGTVMFGETRLRLICEVRDIPPEYGNVSEQGYCAMELLADVGENDPEGWKAVDEIIVATYRASKVKHPTAS